MTNQHQRAVPNLIRWTSPLWLIGMLLGGCFWKKTQPEVIVQCPPPIEIPEVFLKYNPPMYQPLRSYEPEPPSSTSTSGSATTTTD